MKKIYKVEDGKLFVAEKPKDVRVSAGLCHYCREPVLVSSGQLQAYLNGEPTHKKCRP